MVMSRSISSRFPARPPPRLSDIRAYDSAWMPDGRHIVYSHRRAVYQTLLENLATAGSLSE